MPEGPEAYVIATDLSNRLTGKKLVSITETRYTVSSPPIPVNKVVELIYSCGKKVVFVLDELDIIIFSLGLKGQLSFDPTRYEHTHCNTYCFEEHLLTYYMRDHVCSVERYTGEEGLSAVPIIGECLVTDRSINAKYYANKMKLSFKSKLICRAIVDQQVFAGVGNYIRSEALYMARIHPLKKINELKISDIERLYEAIMSVIHTSIHSGGHSIRDYFRPDGSRGEYKPVIFGSDKAQVLTIDGQKVYYCPLRQNGS